MTTDTASDFNPREATDQAVATWLRSALAEHASTNSRWAFAPLTLLLGNRDDLAHDLYAFIDTLPALAKRRWLHAVVSLLADPSIDDDTAVLLIDVAVLSGSREALEHLPALARRPHSSAPLLDRIVDAVLELPVTEHASLRSLQAVTTAGQLQPTSAGTVLVALCHIAPDDWLDHARSVSGRMAKLFEAVDHDPTVVRQYAESVLLEIELERLGKHWHEFANDSGVAWLKDGLQGSQPLVEVRRGALVSKLYPDKRVLIRPSAADRWRHIERNLETLLIDFDRNQRVDKTGFWQVVISPGLVRVPSELQTYTPVSNAADFVAVLPAVQRRRITSSRGVAEAFASATTQAVGLLILEAAKPVPMLHRAPEPDVSRDHYRRAIDVLIDLRATRDRRRKLFDRGFNIAMGDDAVRMPAKVWTVFGRADSAATLLEKMSDDDIAQVQALGWERRRFDDARAHALGEIVTKVFLTVRTETMSQR